MRQKSVLTREITIRHQNHGIKNSYDTDVNIVKFCKYNRNKRAIDGMFLIIVITTVVVGGYGSLWFSDIF